MKIEFPKYSGVRCLMMPYIQGESCSVPEEFRGYAAILESLFFKRGDVGYLTIDESPAFSGKPHRGAHSKHERALHTEAGVRDFSACWGGGGWGTSDFVRLDDGVEVLLANNSNDTCAVWGATHRDTSIDGDLGHIEKYYPYEKSRLMVAGDVERIGIFTPHESLPVKKTFNRQFLRIVSSGVHGRENYFTVNPLMS
jgi:hypothetical protein